MVTTTDALRDLATGTMLILIDDCSAEPHGELLVAAAHATPHAINVMAKHARGLIRLALPSARCDALRLRPTPFMDCGPLAAERTVSIDARDGITTGISAADRARTIAVAIDEAVTPGDLVRPGHVFPVRACDGGLLGNLGAIEAAVDLARLAGLAEAAVMCQILDDDGAVAGRAQLATFAECHRIPVITVSEVAAHRRTQLERVVSTQLPTTFGLFTAIGYRSAADAREHIAFVRGDVRGLEDVPVAIEAPCIVGHVFRSRRCECSSRLQRALQAIDRKRLGLVVYLGRGARTLHCEPAIEPGEVRVAAQILADLGVASRRMVTAY
jgi:3,4-dihydroxy 2-butanone 4-phosphate synthase/GTP cyclohydrolase II